MWIRCAFLLLLFSIFASAKNNPAVTITVRIEANQWNRTKLLEKLNKNSAKHGLIFSLANDGEQYDYRILFSMGKSPEAIIINGTGGTTEYDTGFAAVFDSYDNELFRVKNEAWWNENTATNGTAKKIIQRLIELRPK